LKTAGERAAVSKAVSSWLTSVQCRTLVLEGALNEVALDARSGGAGRLGLLPLLLSLLQQRNSADDQALSAGSGGNGNSGGGGSGNSGGGGSSGGSGVSLAAFVRRCDVGEFKESWAPTAVRLGLVVRVYACPDRLNATQMTRFVFSKTQARHLVYLFGGVGANVPTQKQRADGGEEEGVRRVASELATPDECRLHFFTPQNASPSTRERGDSGGGWHGGGGEEGGSEDDGGVCEEVFTGNENPITLHRVPLAIKWCC